MEGGAPKEGMIPSGTLYGWYSPGGGTMFTMFLGFGPVIVAYPIGATIMGTGVSVRDTIGCGTWP